ncbi:MAG: Ig-like domain-containing protein, partial [Clostridia bacterium]|nr:Ig-like domain-containing protein [Clostridia bacterium]
MKNWLKRFCAMTLVIMMLFSVTAEAVSDGLEVVSNLSEALPVETGEFELTQLGTDDASEAAAREAAAVSAMEAKADADEVAPKSSVPKKAKKVKGVPTELQLGVKETYALSTKKLGKNLSFKSSKEKVATVDKKGVITAKKTGTATITCYSGKKKVAACKVTVVPAPKKVTVKPKKLTVGVGEKVALKATITKGSQATLTWSTKDKKIATVSKDGKITGKKAGKTTVTVKAQNGVKANVTVTVKNAPKKITLNKKKLTLQAGKKVTLKATLPKNTASYMMTWKSSNKKVATVDNKGVVKAVGPGTAKITVTTYKSKVKATCKVTVKAPATPAPTETPTEAPTEAPVEAPTEAPVEAPTEAPVEAPTEAPIEMPTEAPTGAPTEVPTAIPTAVP